MKVGLDIGNSAVKGAILDANNVILEDLTYPSAIARVVDRKYMTFSNPDEFYLQVLTSNLKHFPDIVAVGDKALSIPGYREFDVTSTSYKSNSEIATSLLFGSLINHVSDLADDDHLDIVLAVTVPIVEARHIGLMEDYRKLLEGEHVVLYFTEGSTKRVTINVKMAKVFNEGQAGFFGILDTIDQDFHQSIKDVFQALGETDDPAAIISDLRDFVIVDCGDGTTDIAVFRNKRFSPDYSYSVKSGYGSLLERAIKMADRDGLTMESRKDLQNLLESTVKRHEARKARWSTYVLPTKAEFINEQVDTILSAYGNRDFFDAIIFMGGGFAALTGYDVVDGQIVQRDDALLKTLQSVLHTNHKDADLIFGIPERFSQGINKRGLIQVLSALPDA